MVYKRAPRPKCYIYCRESLTYQGSQSLENQEKVCRKYCNKNRIRIKRAHKEIKSGRQFKNAKTLKDLAAKLNFGDCIVISRVDRLARNKEKTLAFIKGLWQNYRINTISVEENIDYAANPIKFGRLLASAEEFSNQLSLAFCKRNQYLASRGWVFGKPEFGYEIYFDQSGIRRSRRCPDEQKTISFIQTWHNNGHCYLDISRELNKAKRLYRKNKWTAEKIAYVYRNANKRDQQLYSVGSK